MLRDILKYGSIGGVIVGVLMAGSVPVLRGTAFEKYGVAIGYLTMLIGLSTIFVAIKRRRDHDLGGVIGFWPALGLGLGISLIASLFYAIAWEITLANMSGDFMAELVGKTIAEARAAGATPETLAGLTAQMDQFRRAYANPLYRFGTSMTEIFPVGALVSIVAAGLLRNRRFLPARGAVPA